jgi:hypothetical protein
MTHKAGRTTPGNPYVMRFTDGFGNLCTRDVECLDVISTFFENSNVIDSHNQCRQSNLALGKKWLTKDAFFRLATTHLGINIVDTYKIADFHGVINFTKKIIREKNDYSPIFWNTWTLTHNKFSKASRRGITISFSLAATMQYNIYSI